jgi:hypothetical protein
LCCGCVLPCGSGNIITPEQNRTAHTSSYSLQPVSTQNVIIRHHLQTATIIRY